MTNGIMAEDLLASGISLDDVAAFLVARDDVRAINDADFAAEYDGPATERNPPVETAPTLPSPRAA